MALNDAHETIQIKFKKQKRTNRSSFGIFTQASLLFPFQGRRYNWKTSQNNICEIFSKWKDVFEIVINKKHMCKCIYGQIFLLLKF